MILGIVAILFYVIHGSYWIVKGVPANLLWACHLGSVIVGLGMIFKKPVINSVGVLILLMGNIFWFLYLCGDGEFELTSPLTHIGGLLIGLVGVWRMKFVSFSWLRGVIFLALLQIITRWITPESENINLAFRIHDGWESIFPSYGWYEAFLLVQTSVLFFIFEFILKRVKIFKDYEKA